MIQQQKCYGFQCDSNDMPNAASMSKLLRRKIFLRTFYSGIGSFTVWTTKWIRSPESLNSGAYNVEDPRATHDINLSLG